jgi:hypothetical protein
MAGATLDEAGALEGVSAMTALRDLQSLGVERRKPEPAPGERECSRDGCKNMFRPTRRQLDQGYGRFCTRECDHLAHRVHPKPGPRVCAYKHCPRQGEPFTPASDKGSLEERGWNCFCSTACARAAQRGRRQRSKKGRWVKCDNDCGREMWLYDCELSIAHPEGRFCSTECHADHRRRHPWPGANDKTSSFLTPIGRVKFLGRVNGHKGAAAGIEAGREKGGRTRNWGSPEETSARQVKIFELHNAGLSNREVAELVFSDRGKYKRVERLLKR